MAGQLSGQITVTTAGTAVAGPDVRGHEWLVRAHPDNTQEVWVGQDGAGDVTNTNGFPLVPTSEPVRFYAPNLNLLRFDADVNGEKICWLKLNA